MKRKITALIVFALLPILSFAQEENITVDYTPKIIGLLKTKWEHAFEDTTSRFDIRNMRLGVTGNLSPIISYRMQVEYSSNTIGRDLYMVDAYAVIAPSDAFSLTAGQFFVPFSDDYVVSPALLTYANRPFLTKYVNTGSSSRDIGVMGQYNFFGNVPFSLIAGVFNGGGANNTSWQDSPAILGRVIYGNMEGFRASVKYYTRKDILKRRVNQYGIDFRYAKNKYRIESELAVKDSVDVEDSRLWGSYLQGAYSFAINNNRTLKYIEPNIRGDAMGYNIFDKGFDMSRITIGVNFGFVPKALNAELRLNYEKLFFRGSKEDIRNSPEYAVYFINNSDKRMSDKFTIELLLKF